MITGLVRDQAGRPVEAARVSFAGGPVPLPDIATMTGTDGIFRLTAPTPGDYAIVCTLPDGTSQRHSIEVRPGAEPEVTVEMPLDADE